MYLCIMYCFLFLVQVKHFDLRKFFTSFLHVHCTSVSDPDPYHLAGSGSVSGNVDLDPGTKKKIVINSHSNQPNL